MAAASASGSVGGGVGASGSASATAYTHVGSLGVTSKRVEKIKEFFGADKVFVDV